MSSPTSSGCGFLSFRKVFSFRSIRKAPLPSVLPPVLQSLVEASAAFPSLQSAARGLLNVVDTAEVRRLSFQSDSISIIVDLFSAESTSECR